MTKQTDKQPPPEQPPPDVDQADLEAPPEPELGPQRGDVVVLGEADPAGTYLLVVATDEDTVRVAPLETFQIHKSAVQQV